MYTGTMRTTKKNTVCNVMLHLCSMRIRQIHRHQSFGAVLWQCSALLSSVFCSAVCVCYSLLLLLLLPRSVVVVDVVVAVHLFMIP